MGLAHSSHFKSNYYQKLYKNLISYKMHQTTMKNFPKTFFLVSFNFDVAPIFFQKLHKISA